VFIGGRPAWRVAVDHHLCPTGGHGPGTVVIGAPTVLINNAPAVRAGDHVVEPMGGPNVIVEGCSTVSIGVMAAPPEPQASRTLAARPRWA
jgi:uncharacterized Zn-binding protein involved in type VI secretion